MSCKLFHPPWSRVRNMFVHACVWYPHVYYFASVSINVSVHMYMCAYPLTHMYTHSVDCTVDDRLHWQVHPESDLFHGGQVYTIPPTFHPPHMPTHQFQARVLVICIARAPAHIHTSMHQTPAHAPCPPSHARSKSQEAFLSLILLTVIPRNQRLNLQPSAPPSPPLQSE